MCSGGGTCCPGPLANKNLKTQGNWLNLEVFKSFLLINFSLFTGCFFCSRIYIHIIFIEFNYQKLKTKVIGTSNGKMYWASSSPRPPSPFLFLSQRHEGAIKHKHRDWGKPISEALVVESCGLNQAALKRIGSDRKHYTYCKNYSPS